MSEDNKDKVNTSDIGEPQEVETDQDFHQWRLICCGYSWRVRNWKSRFE